MNTIACNYNELYNNRLLIITGTGRSGTTILGKILGSMTPTVYVFEPAIMKYILNQYLLQYDKNELHKLLLATLFEDYFLPIIQGRVNQNIHDWSYYGNYFSEDDLTWRRQNLKRRTDAIAWVRETKPLFIVKIPEYQQYAKYICNILSDTYFVDIIRDGREVVKSTVDMGWYTDDYQVIDYVDHVGVPKFVKESSMYVTLKKPIKRATLVWMELTRQSLVNCMENPKYNIIRYEELCNLPKTTIDRFLDLYDLGIQYTDLTRDHIESIESHKPKEHKLNLSDLGILENAFTLMQKKLGYM